MSIPHEIRLIAKIPPKSSYRRQMYNSARHFAREHFIYEYMFPAFEKFQRLHLKEQYIFKHYPRCVAASSVYEDEYVLLNDLSLQGFQNSDRPTPLHFDKCVAVLKTIAKFHAISFAMKDQQPEKLAKLTSKLNEIMFTAPINNSFENFLKKNVEYSLTTLDPEKDKVIIKKLLEFRENYANFMVDCCAEKEDAIVLHGDCWISNMMFRRNHVSFEQRNSSVLQLLDSGIHGVLFICACFHRIRPTNTIFTSWIGRWYAAAQSPSIYRISFSAARTVKCENVCRSSCEFITIR